MSGDIYGGLAAAQAASSLMGIGSLVESIGEPVFERRLSLLAESICGADQLYLFNVERRQPRVRTALSTDGSDQAASVAKAYALGQLWRHDSSMRDACNDAAPAPRLYQTDLAQSTSEHLRTMLYGRMHLCDRIMLCGRTADDIVGVSLLRTASRGPFESDQRAQIEWFAQLALPLVAKHWSAVDRDRNLSRALTDLPEMERCVALAPEAIPPREASVCVRYLYGQSTEEIAIDLGIGRETVVTYRKRLYDRLGLRSHRELLLWYLDLYGSVRSQGWV